MPKRKRSHHSAAPAANNNEAGDSGDIEPARATAMAHATVEKKIHHADVVYRRALKVCRTFEAQKIGRRIRLVRREGGQRLFKSKKKPRFKERLQSELDHEDLHQERMTDLSTGDPETTQRIEEELTQEEEDERVKLQMERFELEQAALRDIDLDVVSRVHILRLLLKRREVSTHAHFPADKLREELEKLKNGNYCAKNSWPQKEEAARTVAARLYDANKARTSLKGALSGVHAALELEDEDGKGDIKKGEKGKKQEEDVVMKDDEEENDSEDGEENEDEDQEQIEEEGMELDEETLAMFDKRIARSGSEDESEADEDPNSDDDDDDGLRAGRGHSMSITPEPADGQISEGQSDDDDDLESSESDSDSDKASLAPEPEPKKSKSSKSKSESKSSSSSSKSKSKSQPEQELQQQKPSASSFLPTLMSGYISGSESDDDDGEQQSSKNNNKKQKRGPAEKKERKNRMGQQARRALAEKKYGQQAKHILKEQEVKEERKKQKEERKKKWEEKQNKPVHPSWQAKKSAQEEKDRIIREAMRKTTTSAGGTGGGGTGIGAGAASKGLGKKIVFDD